MRRFENLRQAKKYLETRSHYERYGVCGMSVFKVPKKYQKGRFKKKPYAVTDSLDWLHFGF
jgi:hypothetical protein